MRPDPNPSTPTRRPLPDECDSITHKFEIAGYEGWVTVSKYPDGKPGKIFLTLAKQNSQTNGFADAFAKAVSTSLQYGVPVEEIAEDFVGTRFEPAGATKNADIPYAKSIVGYVLDWMKVVFVQRLKPEATSLTLVSTSRPDADVPLCETCGRAKTPVGTRDWKCEHPDCRTIRMFAGDPPDS